MKKLILIFVLLCAVQSFGAIAHQAANCTGQAGSAGAFTNAWTFTCTPQATGNAVVFAVTCVSTSGNISAISLAATGWTFQQIGSSMGTGSTNATAIFGAVAPNTSATTFTATFTGATNCNNFRMHEHDEFTGNDTTGGTTTFYSRATNVATATCGSTAVTSTSASDAVWSWCGDSLGASATGGAPWTNGVNDTQGDATIYAIGVNGSQTPSWSASSGTPHQGSTTIKAAGGAVAKPCTLSLMGAGPC